MSLVDDDQQSSATTRLWAGLDDVVAQSEALTALCGIPAATADDVMMLFVAQSDEVEDFLAHVPDMFRHLAHQSSTRLTRCVGHIRGPIMWAETITCWSSGLGVDDIFVCGAPARDFDVAENRLVVWLLRRIVQAAARNDSAAHLYFDRPALDRAVRHGATARQLLGHRALAGIDGRRLTQRDLRRVVTSRNAATYEIATDLHAQMLRPFEADDIADTCDDATLEEHRVIDLIFEALRERNHAIPLISVTGGNLKSGLLTYRSASNATNLASTGIHFGPVLVHTTARRAIGLSGTSGTRGTRRASELWARECTVVDAAGAQELVDDVLETQSTSGLTQLSGSYSSSSSSSSTSTELSGASPSTGESFRIDS